MTDVCVGALNTAFLLHPFWLFLSLAQKTGKMQICISKLCVLFLKIAFLSVGFWLQKKTFSAFFLPKDATKLQNIDFNRKWNLFEMIPQTKRQM